MEKIWEGINIRLNKAKDQISDLEDMVAENTPLQQQKEKRILKMKVV